MAVGLDNGFLFVGKFDMNIKTNHEEVYFEKIHQSRVMGIHFKNPKHIYSISEDYTLRLTDISKNQVISSVNVNNSKLCKMLVDNTRDFALITDRKGNIHIYDLSQETLVSA